MTVTGIIHTPIITIPGSMILGTMIPGTIVHGIMSRITTGHIIMVRLIIQGLHI